MAILPSPKWSKVQQLYWNTHLELVALLGAIGPQWPATRRPDMFRLRNKLNEVYREQDPENVDKAVGLIDKLVQMRIWGYEPSSINGRYV